MIKAYQLLQKQDHYLFYSFLMHSMLKNITLMLMCELMSLYVIQKVAFLNKKEQSIFSSYAFECFYRDLHGESK